MSRCSPAAVQLGALQQVVEGPVQAGDRQVQALALAARILGHDLGQSRALLVQHGAADGEARGRGSTPPAGSAAGRCLPSAGSRCAARGRRRRPARPAPWRWSRAPRPPPRCSGAPCGSAPPARRSRGRRAGSARPSASDRSPRRSRADRRNWDGIARRPAPGAGRGGDVADQALADPQPRPVHGLGLQALRWRRARAPRRRA